MPLAVVDVGYFMTNETNVASDLPTNTSIFLFFKN
jgi:hypothetical protein